MRGRLHHTLALAGLLVLTALTGCLTLPPASVENAAAVPPLDVATVVAVMAEDGVNVYHEEFRVNAAENASLAQLAVQLGAVPIHLASGNGSVIERYQQDRERLEELDTRTLYWVTGTRVFGIDFIEQNQILDYDYPLFSPDSHGTGVASRILGASPDSIILVVKTNTISYTEDSTDPEHSYMSRSLVDGTEWAAEQPWVDVMTYSIGYPGNPPDASPVTPETLRFVQATRRAHENGKIVTFGAGNTVAPPHFAPLAGPPWVVSVGGVRQEEQGNWLDSAKAPDFAAYMGLEAAAYDTTNGTRHFGGTSSAAPGLAGSVARVVHHLRAQAGLTGPREAHGPFVPENSFAPDSPPIGPREVRAALNATATYPEVTDWDPTTNISADDLVSAAYSSGNLTMPVLPVLPAAQIGWGLVHTDETDAALALLMEYVRTGNARVLLPPADKGAENVAFMQGSWTARSAYWDAKTSKPTTW